LSGERVRDLIPFVHVADVARSIAFYKDCKALNRAYPHGVGRVNARDKTSGKRVTNFERSNRVYSYNDGTGGAPPREYDLDRDKDGIACEKL
jgi:hypothetical protein